MIIAILQARMGSTRLPGKVMMRAGKKTMLQHVVERLRKARTIDEIIVATTTAPKDAVLARHAQSLGVSVFRGDEKDVLGRYYEAARTRKPDGIVRITADCPLLDPAVVDRVVGAYKTARGSFDYVSNVAPQTFPVGMAVEVFSFKALKQAWEKAQKPLEREHVTHYIRDPNQNFRRHNVVSPKDYSYLRITVDELADLRVVRRILARLSKEKKKGTLSDIVRILEQDAKLGALNTHVETILQERKTSDR